VDFRLASGTKHELDTLSASVPRVCSHMLPGSTAAHRHSESFDVMDHYVAAPLQQVESVEIHTSWCSIAALVGYAVLLLLAGDFARAFRRSCTSLADMAAVTFDTQGFIYRLKLGGIPECQAEAIASAMAEALASATRI
jgi:hypothetical protein